MKRQLNRLFLIWLLGWIGLPACTLAQEGKQKLTLEETLSFSIFRQMPRGLQWLPGGNKFSQIKRNPKTFAAEIWVTDAGSGESGLLVSGDKLLGESSATQMGGSRGHGMSLGSYIWMPREDGLILSNDGDIWLYNLQDRRLKRLTSTAAEETEIDVSPDGRYVSFIRNQNLYALEIAGGKEIQLTRDGGGTVTNGKFDWVYQEELVARGNFRAYFWSPTSDRIAFLRFDEAPVPEYPLVDWRPLNGAVEMMRYPKAGDPNSLVKVGVAALADPEKTVWIDNNEESDAYFPRLYWLPDGKRVAYMRLDRRQQNLEFVFGDAASGRQQVVIRESDPYWVNIGDYVHFFQKQPRFLWGSERDGGYNHLYLYDYDGKLQKQLTKGEWLVDELEGVDEKGGWIYYTSTEQDLRERQLYRIKTDGSKKQQLTRQSGNHTINLSPRASYYLDYFSSVSSSLAIGAYTASGKQTATLLEADRSQAEKYELSERELLTFQGDNGLTYYAEMIKPVPFDPNQRYPVLIDVYGGPHHQQVRNRGSMGLWEQFLAQQGYIIFSMDNRGAGGRGHQWEIPLHKNMGAVELEDQLRGVAYLKSLPYVDGERIGISGWSYGGYMVLYALTHSKAFRCGIAGGSVSDWRFYDTAYTERYMGLPAENEEGYRTSAPANAADSLHGELLLVHGTSDDNVHLQNAMHMADALINAGKQFQMMFYPYQPHGIITPSGRHHERRLMFNFLEQHLKDQATGQ